MTPKEKAKQLVEKFEDELMECDTYFLEVAKRKCALIAVDEVIEQEKNWIRQTGKGNSNYYKQVKQEIENL